MIENTLGNSSLNGKLGLSIMQRIDESDPVVKAIDSWFSNAGNRARLYETIKKISQIDPDSLVQETHLKLLTFYSSGNPIYQPTLTGLIFATARHLALDEHKSVTSRYIRATIDLSAANARELPDNSDIESCVEWKRAAEITQYQLSYLSTELRQILLMKGYGFTYSEISRRSGIPEGTVKTRVHRGRRELQQRIASTYPLKELMMM